MLKKAEPKHNSVSSKTEKGVHKMALNDISMNYV